jgi:uncharacterized membrane protein YcaP (DUF421 family)
MADFIGIALRVSVIYLYALLLLRLSGKRSVASLTMLDFIVALILGDMFDDFIWGIVPVAKGLVGLTTVLLLHSLMAWATHKSQALHDLVDSVPRTVIRAGQLVPEGLAAERTPAAEIEMEMRLLGEDKFEEIEEACWEPSGEMSIRKTPAAKPVQKRDLAALRKVT